jgi:hypothetical protein
MHQISACVRNLYRGANLLYFAKLVYATAPIIENGALQ